MKKLLKIIGILALAFVAAICVAAAGVYFASNAKLKKPYEVTVRPVAALTTPEALERGRHLAVTRGCTTCHGDNFAGTVVIDDPAMGLIAAPNITLGTGGRGATFSDVDFVRAIKYGVAPDGHGLFLMPSEDFESLTDQDLGSIVGYVKSMPPVDQPRIPIQLGPVGRVLLLTGGVKLAPDKVDPSKMDPGTITIEPTAAYGAYVVKACVGCHGTNLSGGPIPGGAPDWPPAANLTPDAEGRVKGWSEADFINTLRTHHRPDGTELNEVMPAAFGQMDDTELKALWAYIRTMPAATTGVH